MNRDKRIGFVGLGRMGANMARCLSDAGWNIAVFHDYHFPLAEALAGELGGRAAASLREVTAGCDVIFTVVSDASAMAEIFALDGGLLENATGKVFINCATLSPQAHESAEAVAQKSGAEVIAASMASSIPQARDGTLFLMVGCKEAVYKEHRSLLEDLSGTLKYVGEVSDAAKIKALVNMVMNMNTAALAEGLGLGRALGIDLTMLREVFSQTGANSRVLETDAEDMVEREHECYFSVAHAAKDSGIANDLAAEAGISVPLSSATAQQYQKLIDGGRGELDKSAVAELTFPGRWT